MWTFLWKVVSFFSLGKEMSLVHYTAAVITLKGFYNGARSKFFMNPIHIPSKVGMYMTIGPDLSDDNDDFLTEKCSTKYERTVLNLDDALFLFKLFCIQHSR